MSQSPTSPAEEKAPSVAEDKKSQRSNTPATASPRNSRRRSTSRDRRRNRDRSSSRHRSRRDHDPYRRSRSREGDRERRRHGSREDRYRDRERDRDRRRDYDRDKERERRRKREDSMESKHHSKRPKEGDAEGTNGMDVDSSVNDNSDDRSRNASPPNGDRSGRTPRDRSTSTPRRSSGRDRDYRSPRYDDRDYRDRRYSRSGRYDDDDRRRDDVDRPPRRNNEDRPPRRRGSPRYDRGETPRPDADSEARSVFVSQLAARLTARDLAFFFEEKLGEGSVKDSRIVTDRLSRRSKGIAYVELASIDLVSKAIGLTGTIVMGLPIMVQASEAERNRQATTSDSLNLPPGVTAPSQGMQLYVGSLHFNLTESDIKQVFEPFGELDFVDLHRDPQTGRSKGYAFVQYKRAEDAKMALEQMEGFELAGRQLRVNTVHEKGSNRVVPDSLDEGGGGNLNSVSRQALMQKLARTEIPAARPAPIMRFTNIPAAMTSKCLVLKNMFDPDEETEPDWDKELATDVKDECESKYGKVERLKVEVESQGEIYIKFDSVETATNALEGLNGRWFGGKQVSAAYISDMIMDAHQ